MAKASGAAGGKKSTKSITKSEFFNRIAEATDLKKAEVAKVFDAITDIIKKELSQKGPGVLTIPGLFKLKATRKPADPGGKDILNRFTGQMMKSKPKPASTQVRARALKGLKDMLK
jgi:nucleoid DNA-binding protein